MNFITTADMLFHCYDSYTNNRQMRMSGCEEYENLISPYISIAMSMLGPLFVIVFKVTCCWLMMFLVLVLINNKNKKNHM